MSGPAMSACERRDRRPRIDRDDSVLVGEKRVNVEFADFRHVGGELRELHQHQRNLVNTSGGHVAVGLQHVRDARARDQLTGEVEVEGWQRQRLHQEIGAFESFRRPNSGAI